MGPHSIECGNLERPARSAAALLLQWGRTQLSAEIRLAASWVRSSPSLLQWGRTQLSAEIAPLATAEFSKNFWSLCERPTPPAPGIGSALPRLVRKYSIRKPFPGSSGGRVFIITSPLASHSPIARSARYAHLADSFPFGAAQGFGRLPPRLRSGLRLTGLGSPAPLRRQTQTWEQPRRPPRITSKADSGPGWERQTESAAEPLDLQAGFSLKAKIIPSTSSALWQCP